MKLSWIDDLIHGEKAAGDRFVVEHYARIYRLLRYLTGHTQTAEDLTQTTFIKAWQALPRFQRKAQLATWLHKIAYHEYTHWLRAKNAFGTYLGLIETIDLSNITYLRQFDKDGEWDRGGILRSGEYNIPDNDHAQILKMADTILQRNARELKVLRNTLNVVYLDPYRYHLDDHSIAVQFKKLQSLLLLDAVAAQERKDYAHVAHAALDVLQLASQLQQYTHLGGKMGLMRWETPARNLLWDVLPKLNAATLEQMSKRLDTIIDLSDQVTTDKTLLHEKIRGQQALLHLFQEPDWRWKAASEYYNGRYAPRPTWVGFVALLKWSKQEVFDNYNAIMQEEIEWSKQPYALTKQQRENKRPSDPVSEMLAPFWDNTTFPDTVSHTQNKLLRAAMAIEHFRLLTGAYPEEEIPCGYGRTGTEFGIAETCDPFTTDSKNIALLRYKRTKTGYLLYSIGPDGKDDGGKPIVSTKLNKGNSYYYAVRDDSRGDIVAGINRQ